MNIKFLRFQESDIPEVTKIMTEAFNYDSQIHLGCNGGPDGYDDGSFLKKWALNKKATSFKILINDELAGATVLWINQNKENFLGCIFLHPRFEDKGIGTEIWKLIEKMYPDTKIWRTETPIFSHRNHNFYVNKCGFHVIHINNPKDINEGSFILEKKMGSNK